MCSPYDIQDGGSAPNQKPPAWDRFRFYVNMEDYALSDDEEEEASTATTTTPLDKRTMWLVGRYSAGIDLIAEGSSSAMSESGNGSVDNGLHSRTSSFERIVIPPTNREEWWDNNNGKNYKIAFRRVFASAAKDSSAPSRERKEEVIGGAGATAGGVGKPQMYRRISAPCTSPSFLYLLVHLLTPFFSSDILCPSSTTTNIPIHIIASSHLTIIRSQHRSSRTTTPKRIQRTQRSVGAEHVGQAEEVESEELCCSFCFFACHTFFRNLAFVY